MTRTDFPRALLTGSLLVLCTLTLPAAPGFWQAATQADFLKGDVEQLSVDEHGRLTLGPEVARIFDGAVTVVWTMTTAADGTTFLGTGNDGKVFKVAPDGTGTLFFDSAELEVHALAPAPDGGLYVATSPDGRIYRVDSRGQATTFFDPEDTYIWALVADAKGMVYAATGDKGTVYRIQPDGKGEPYFGTKATHATTLRLESGGALIVGTANPARVFRVDGANKGFLLLDTPFHEVRAVRGDNKGVLYVAALNGKPAAGANEDRDETPPAPTPPPTPSVSTDILSFAVIDVPVSGQATASPGGREANAAPSGAVYRIQPDGLYDLLWESKLDSPYDVSVEPDGSLLVATGDKGKVFRLSGEPVTPVLVTSVPAQHATTLVRLKDRTLLATANPGLLVAMSNGRASRGIYTSDVKDAKMVASWGTLSWRAISPAGARVELYTRAGNTRTPDETWSDWAGPYADADGSAITSPKARYLQWRAVLSGSAATPILTSVSAAYLQRNIRPRVESITVHPAGVAFQKPFSTGEMEIAGFDEEPQERRLANQGAGGAAQMGAPTLGRRIYQRGLQTLAWKAEDENGDDLAYTVLYRREGETGWRTLKSDLADTLTVWDTSSAPNGTYVVKIVASDAATHPADLALTGELESESFEIDNTPPVVSIGSVGRDSQLFVVPVEVRDADSPLVKVEYTLDAQKWQTAYPRDGMLDSRRELFEIRLNGASSGRVLVVRASDALNNVSAGQVLLPASR
jgi:sugar lactone lactonase YvrE